LSEVPEGWQAPNRDAVTAYAAQTARAGEMMMAHDVSHMASSFIQPCSRIAGYYRFDFFFAFLAFFFGIIFLTAFLTVLTADFAAPTTRLVTDFFFDFLAMVAPQRLDFLDLDFFLVVLFLAGFFVFLPTAFFTFFAAFLVVFLGAFAAFATALAAFLTGFGVWLITAFLARLATAFTAVFASSPAASATTSVI
jgi:hypothetical protein